jgi:WD40 repeat protein
MANWGVRVTVIETASRRQVWTSNLRPENSSLGESLSLAFSPDGRSLAAVGSHVFLVLDAATGAVKTEFAQREVHAAPVAFSPDGRWLVGPADGPAFQLWDVETKRPSYRWPVVDEGSLVNKCASFSPDGRYLLLGRGPEQLGIIDLSTGQDVAEIKSAIDISACAITPDWRVLVTAGGGYVQVWQRK